jgi:DNA replication protein DnaC
MLLWKQCDRWNEYRLRRKLAAAGVGERLLSCRFSTYEERTEELAQARSIAEQYVETYAPSSAMNLLLNGPTGTGKSHLAIACVAALFVARKVTGPLVAYAPDLIESIRRTELLDADDDDQLVTEAARDTDLLVLDDLNAEAVSAWTRKKLSSLMNERWQSAKPTIVTTNETTLALEQSYGAPFMSRLLPAGQYATALMMAPDQRRGGPTRG